MAKGVSAWAPGMERRADSEDGWQVKCLTADAGHVWMDWFDDLPAPVRRRLATSRHNICAACLTIEARRRAKRRRWREPTIEIYFKSIVAIETLLDGPPLPQPEKKKTQRGSEPPALRDP